MAVPKLRFKDENGADYPEWKVGRLKDYGKAIGGYGFPEKYQGIIDNKIPFFKVSDMNTVGNEITMNIANNTISTETAKEIKVKPFLKKAIVFAKVGAAVYLERKRKAEPPFLVDNNMMIYQSDSIDFDYLYHWFSNQKISRYAQIGALPSYNAGDIHSVKISVPCLEEQQKIADFLTTFDKRITAQQNIIADMEETKKGLLQKIFSQEIRFKDDNGEDYPDWEKKKLGDIATKIGSGKTPLGGSSVYTDCGVIFLRSQNIGWGEMLLDDITYIDENTNNSMLSSQVKKDDLLLNITGASIGRCSKYYLCQLANVNQHVCIIRLNQSNADFILQQMIADIVQNQIEQLQAGGNRQGLNFKNVSEIKVKIPCLAEQNKIASFLSAHDKKIEAEKKILADLQEMKKGLLQQMFV